MQTQIIHSLSEVSHEEWNALIGSDFPFLEHAFLLALESSRSVGGRSGWSPRHLLLREQGRLVAACPLYGRTNSYGEYIFDWSWAEAYERNGFRYYPKLTSAIPYTPATLPKLLTHPEEDSGLRRRQLIEASLEEMRRLRGSSLHFLFIPPEEIPDYEACGLFIRHSYQFHWKNQDYASFEDFLAALKRRRRKEILRERRQVREQGLNVHRLTGEQITPELGSLFYGYYVDTIDRKWGQPYLTPEFFETVFRTLRDQIVLVLAEHEGQWVAGALNYRKGDCLYGRYWGCLEQFRSLHFEVCYYQAIEYAIEEGLRLFEAGAQGPHKIQRGFLPERTYSAHWIEHPGFREAIQRFVEEERRQITAGFAEIQDSLPFASFASCSKGS